MEINTIILIILILGFICFAILVLMGKCDKWYLWSLTPVERDMYNIARWRILTSCMILAFLLVIAIFKIAKIGEHLDWALVVLAIIGAIIKHKWVRINK